MKKRLLSALLALALVFVLLPTTALAGVTTGKDYDISINGKGWKFEKDTPVYFYGYDPSNYFFSTTADHQWTTNSNLMLTKEGNTVTITIRPSKYHPYESPQFTLKKESTSTEKNDVPCIKMGNDNNLVITGKGTLNITRNENKSYGAALYSNVGDITINGGITVNVSFLNGKDYYNKNVSSNAIYVGDNHNLTVSGSGTNVIATNQGFHSSPATVCVEGGTITVSGGASLSATNTYADNFSGSSVTQHFKSYAISGTESKPCTLIVADEKSSVTAWAYDEKYGKPFGFVTYNITGATVKAGSNAYYATETNIDNINGKEYVKISVPALQRTSDVLIAGKDAVVGVETSIPSANGSGTYFYDQASKTLTLKDVNITKGINAIQFMANGSYTINLAGTNQISNVSSGIVAPNVSGVDDVTVVLSGSGSLDISANQYAIDMQVGNLKFENTGKIMLTTGYKFTYPLNALRVKTGSITIDKAKYDIVGVKQDKDGTREDISDNPNLDTILKGTSAEEDLYFKTITITPAAAKDSTIRYNGTTLKQGETIRNGGTATVDSKNNTITLKNFNGTAALSFDATLADSTLVLEGTNTLSSIVTTQKGLTISGSGSLTVGSIKVHNQKASSDDKPNLTINGATVTVGTAELTTRAIDIDGDLTVTNGSLTATSKSNNVPTVQVGGNASFTGSTVTITNNSTALHKDAAGSTKGDSVSSALYVKGNINTDNANVTAKVENGGGNAIGALGNITVNGSNVTAVNKGQKFTTIIAKNVYVSGDSKITANNLNENPVYNGSYLAFPAIEGNIVNQNTDYSLMFVGERNGSSEPETTLAPGEKTTLYYYNVTITRGDEVVHTPSPVVIAGTTLLNDTFYTINGSTVAEGTESNYNAFYNSTTKTLKLNNAKISTTTGTAIKIEEDLTITVTGTNELNGNYNHCIESDNNFKINGTGTLVMTNGSNTDASVIYCGIGKSLIIAAEVIIKNEAQPGKLIHTVEDDAYSFAEGYNVYASTNVSGSPLEVYNPENYSAYKYLRVTKETLETGGGSTHEHVFSTTSWESNADYHWHKCTVQGCTEVSDKEEHVYTNTWWKNSNGNHGRTCDKCRHEGEIHEFRKYYDFADETYHVERCGYLNCTYVGRQETHSYDSFGVCKCGYSPNGLPAPPSLQGVAPTSENGTDGKILNSNIGMEYAQNLNGPWTKWNEHSNITGLSAGTYYVRYTKTDERFPDNQVATVEVPAYTPGGDPTPDVPAAPTGLAGVAPTSENGNGKITGTTAQMEYASSLEGDWTTCANDSTDVPAGKYYVRMKKTDNTPAGEVVEVTVPAYSGTGEIEPPTPDNPGTIVIIRPAEEEKPAQQPNPSTGANDLVGLAVAAAVAAALGSAALLRKHD